MKYLSRLTALLLAFVLLFSSSVGVIAESDISDLTRSGYDQMVSAAKEAAEAEAAAAAQEAASQPIINEGGVVYEQDIPEQTKRFDIYEVITDAQLSMGGETEITLPQSGKINLSAGTAAQWQIYIPGADMWVNIAGETGDTFALTYAVIGGMLSGGSAKVRALAGDSAAVANVTVAYGSALPPVEEEETFAAEPMMASTFALRRSASTSDANAGIMLAEEGDDQRTTYNVVVNYIFENNDIVADPYTANLAKGSSFSTTVTFPTVQGYLPYLGTATESTTSLPLNITNIQADQTYTVTYKPTNVDYTVIHYWQNVDNDNYTEHEREKLQGLTKSTVLEVAKVYADSNGNTVVKDSDYNGFYSLIYEKPTIAADGSTVVEIYYDRSYYLMNFDLDGGYGVEPIYARYGAAIEVGTPTKAGYTFQGWLLNDANATIPATMPAENRSYKANWKANDTAKVTVVFWGENADDEGYSYYKTGTLDVKVGSSFTYAEDDTRFLVCGLEAHTHVETCEATLTCQKTVHTHSSSCCSISTSHTHSRTCYDNVASNSANLYYAPDDAVDGYVYYSEAYRNYYVHIDGRWYRYTGNSSNVSDGKIIAPGSNCSAHIHGEGECACELEEHTHSEAANCYTYSCGKTEHSHIDSCYQNGSGMDSKLWKFVKSDTATVVADGSTVINVYYDRTTFTLTFRRDYSTVKTITEKWGADIHDEFPIKDGSDTMWWTVPNSSTTMKPGTEFGSLDTMPAENITFTYNSKTSEVTLHYYVEALPNEDGKTASQINSDFTSNNYANLDTTKKFVSYKDINVTTGVYLTYTEEFHNIAGFRQYVSDPKFDKHEQGGTTNYIYDDCYLLYARNAFDIVFYNPTELIKTQENVPYQMPLSNYNWTPEASQAPAQYEPGSVKFAGWYLNPECSGEKFDFAKQKMPSGPNNENGEVALSLYAKWEPVTLTVEFYLDKTEYDAGNKLSTHPDKTVLHGNLVTPTPEVPKNGDYTFIGWFYMDGDTEKAFDFENMPVKQNLKVYGKWSSKVLKEYKVYFKIQGTDTEIADPVIGSTLAGETKTFDAKGGTDLYAKYQEGYFPIVKSHSLTLDIEDETQNTFTFWYVQKDAIPYTVKYLNAVTGEPLLTEKVVSNNRKAVVTETFEQIPGYMPDAYQKRLVVDASNGAVNEIIFYYTEDTKHAYYKITHLIKNLEGEGWTEYTSSQAVGDIGNRYTGSPLTIPGFTYNRIEYVVNKVPVTEDITTEGVKLTNAGLEINLYYVRNEYPYQVRYLEQGTGKELHVPKDGAGLYGQVISESARDDIANYTAVAPTSQTLNIRIEESQTEAKLNIITFYYTENEATINYVVVGPTGCGTVTPESETLKVLTGEAKGSTATASSNVYRFVGWFSDEKCTKAVDPSWVNGTKITPTKAADAVWVDTTYYAKFEYNLTSMTITKTGDNVDESAVFLFTVKDADSDFETQIAIEGTGSKTIYGVTVGNKITVTEETDWSWRYTPGSSSVEKTINEDATKNVYEFNNSPTNNKWLDDDCIAVNDF